MTFVHSPHSGFQHTPLQDIEALRDLLRDQYDDRSIYKELIQNADDAQAERVLFALLPGDPRSPHPLLTAPALLVLNDGAFRAADVSGIHSLRSGTKVGDAGAIGKFGLGLKSVFHLCEAFFYMASRDQEASLAAAAGTGAAPPGGGGPLAGILNPWTRPREAHGFHDRWNEAVDALGPVIERVEGLAAGEWRSGARPPRWFALLIPLREQVQYANDSGSRECYILRHCPQPDALFWRGLGRETAQMLPLLRRVKEVTFLDLRADAPRREVASVRLEGGSERAFGTDALRLRAGDVHPFAGTIRVRGEECPTEGLEVVYVGTETRCGAPELGALRDAADWPRRIGHDPDTGEQQDKRVEADPHAAVVFTATPAAHRDGGRFTVGDAVFLPLATSLTPGGKPVWLPGRYDYTLALHGFFFLDSSRKALKAADPWNRVLRRQGTLPLVLPTLKHFVERLGLDAAGCEALTRELQRHAPFAGAGGDDRDALYRDGQWLPRLSGGGEVAWDVLPPGTQYRELPSPPRPDLPFVLFPGLAAVCRRDAVVYANAPRLTPDDPAPWTGAGTEALARVDDATLYGEAESRDYLQRALDRIGPDVPSPVWRAACEAIARGYRRAGRLTTTDAISWANFALEMLRRMPGTPSEKAALVGDIALFRVYDETLTGEGEERTRLAAWRELAVTFAAGTLFNHLGSDAAPALQKALDGCRVLRLADTAARDVLFVRESAERVRGCTAESCALLLAELRPALAAEPAARVNLLLLLVSGEVGALSRRRAAVRYLLHARAEQFDSNEILYVAPRGADVWARIGKRLLKDSWRIVPTALSERLNAVQMNDLALQDISPETVGRLLSQVLVRPGGLDDIAALPWSRPDDAVPVLTALRGDAAVWEAVPLHRTAGADADRYVSIGGERAAGRGVYRHDPDRDYAVPAVLEGAVTLVREPYDSPDALRARYGAIPAWGPAAALDVFLAGDGSRAASHPADVLDALHSLAPAGVLPGSQYALRERLRKGQWLPLPGGLSGIGAPPVAPENVVHIPGMEDELARLLSEPELSGTYYAPPHLDPSVGNHPAAQVLRAELFATGDDALDALSLCLGEAQRYHIGDLARLRVRDGESAAGAAAGLADFLTAFDAEGDTMPAVPHLRSLVRCLSMTGPAEAGTSSPGTRAESAPQGIARRLLPALLNTPPGQAGRQLLASCMGVLAGHRARAAGEQEAVLRTFDDYLRAFVARRDYQAHDLAGVRLLNRAGRWKPAEELMIAADGIAADDMVCERQGRYLKSAHAEMPAETHGAPAGTATTAAQALPRTLPEDEARATERLKQYFSPWPDQLYEAVGGLLSLLAEKGDGPTRELAQEFLQHRWKVDQVRDLLGPLPTRFRWAVRVIPADQASIRAVSLTGTPFDATIDRSATPSLLIGRPNAFETGSWDCMALNLRALDPKREGASRLAELARETAEAVLRAMTTSGGQRLSDLWAKLTTSDQMDVEATQGVILRNANGFLRQLVSEFPADSQVRHLCRDMKQLSYDETLAEREGDESKRRDVDRLWQEKRAALRRLFEEDPATQSALLGAVRARVAQSQYRSDSVPFELFQNADDAAVERAELMGEPDHPDRIVLDWGSHAFYCLHWGRPINRFRGERLTATEGRRRGWSEDLEKMLILSASDKGGLGSAPDAADDETNGAPARCTGKFGLGFKSVFLVTEAPEVLSERLAFGVTGGIFPRPLSPEARDTLRELRHEYSSDDEEREVGTVIRLPGAGLATAMNAGRFRLLAPLLLAFAQRIKECRLVEPVADDPAAGKEGAVRTTVLHWTEELLRETRDVRVCVGSVTGDTARYLLLRDARPGGTGALVFRLGAAGVEPFRAEFPTLWVTAPTGELLDAGVAVNGPFPIDVGRSRIAAEQAEDDGAVVARLAAAFGAGLLELHDLTSTDGDYDTFRRAAGVAATVDRYAFFDTLEGTLRRAARRTRDSADPAARLLRRLLWDGISGEPGAARRLYAGRAALPSGLPGMYRELVRIADLLYFTTGALEPSGDEAAPERFREVTGWPGVAERLKPGNVVAASVTNALPELTAGVALTGIGLVDAVRWESASAAGRGLQPGQAERMGRVIRPDTQRHLFEREATRKDVLETEDALHELPFATAGGGALPARELVIPSADLPGSRAAADRQDEAKRAAFAPAGIVLALDYTGREDALHLVLAARFLQRHSYRSDDAQRLAEWGTTAQDEERQDAFLRYMATGLLRNEVAANLRGGTGGTWLDGVNTDRLERVLADPAAAVQVLALLRPAALYQAISPGMSGQPGAGIGSPGRDAVDDPYGDEYGEDEDSAPSPSSVGGEGGRAPIGGTQTPVDAGRRLREIADWWSAQGTKAREDCLTATYYDGGEFITRIRPQFGATNAERKAWLTLLLRGSLETMGRVKPEAHREFLWLCEREGWLDALVDARSSDSREKLLAKFDRWLDSHIQDVQYFHWLRYLLPFALLVRRLDEYIHVFSAVNAQQEKFEMYRLLQPRLDGRVGADAPPIAPALGIGAHFVLRELARTGLVTNPKAMRFCFVPGSQVRSLMRDLGAPIPRAQSTDTLTLRAQQAEAIWDFVREHLGEDAARFDGWFDVPLRLWDRY